MLVSVYVYVRIRKWWWWCGGGGYLVEHTYIYMYIDIR